MLPVRDLTIYVASSAEHHQIHAKALSEGLKLHGINVLVRNNPGISPLPTKFVACWGWRIGLRLRKMGGEVLVMERGYIGDRFSWTSLGWNGLNGRATFYPKEDPNRFQENFGALLKPWKDGGKYVLLIGQVPGDASLGGVDLSSWYEKAAREAAKAYGLPVRFRPHPMVLKRGIRQKVRAVETMNGNLSEALDDAAVCVTFNSNTAVESVLAGVPTVATNHGTMAYEVAARTIGQICKPQRESWANKLAWCQWSIEEIKSGVAWEAIQPR